MDFLQQYAKELFALLVPFITWALNGQQRGQARLVRGIRHQHIYLVNQPLMNPQGVLLAPTQTARTASVVIYNKGKKPATNVELVFNYRPMCVNFWPLRSRTEKPQDDGRIAYVFESLAPGEALGFELLGVNAELPALVHVRSDQGAAEEVSFTQYPTVPRWRRRLVVTLALMGTGAAAYLFLLLVQFLIVQTPAVLGR